MMKEESGFLTNIEDNRFHWENITVKDDGEWDINAEIYAERII